MLQKLQLKYTFIKSIIYKKSVNAMGKTKEKNIDGTKHFKIKKRNVGQKMQIGRHLYWRQESNHGSLATESNLGKK